jgi:hypothetical protein
MSVAATVPFDSESHGLNALDRVTVPRRFPPIRPTRGISGSGHTKRLPWPRHRLRHQGFVIDCEKVSTPLPRKNFRKSFPRSAPSGLSRPITVRRTRPAGATPSMPPVGEHAGELCLSSHGRHASRRRHGGARAARRPGAAAAVEELGALVWVDTRRLRQDYRHDAKMPCVRNSSPRRGHERRLQSH